MAYLGKITVHPVPVQSLAGLINRADIGPIPGEVILGLGGLYIGSWTALALWIGHRDAKRIRERGGVPAMG